MNLTTKVISVLVACSAPALALGPIGGVYSIPWSTIDGGGAINSTGGSFTLSGTIGQPDAGSAMTGGSFSLTGGFWAGVNSAADCGIADINGDNELDFLDISLFLNAFSSNAPAADFNNDGQWDFLDISLFLGAFTAGCP